MRYKIIRYRRIYNKTAWSSGLDLPFLYPILFPLTRLTKFERVLFVKHTTNDKVDRFLRYVHIIRLLFPLHHPLPSLPIPSLFSFSSSSHFTSFHTCFSITRRCIRSRCSTWVSNERDLGVANGFLFWHKLCLVLKNQIGYTQKTDIFFFLFFLNITHVLINFFL